MEQAALKLELIEWLAKLTDKETLAFLKVVKESKKPVGDWWEELPQDQKLGIERGMADISNGRTTAHADVKKKYGL